MDSNLLLLLVVGSWNPKAIRQHRRLTDFSADDFELLRNFLGGFGRVVTTPHILTEVSNLAGVATGHARDLIFAQLASTIDILEERTLDAVNLSVQREFLPFGLTDAALSLLCDEMTLLTQDGRLARHLQLRGLTALALDDVRHLRQVANDGN